MTNKDNEGVLFTAKKKTTDKSPDYTGNLTVGGVSYDLSGWQNTSAGGTSYIKIKPKPRALSPETEAALAQMKEAAASPTPYTATLDDEIPF